MIPLTKHQNVLMRRLALKALATLKDPEGLPTLEEALRDPESSVRISAASALAAVHGPHTVTRLVEAVRSDRFQLFEAARGTLSSLDAQYLPDIIKAAGDKNARVRVMAMYAFGARSAPEALPALLAGLKDPDAFVRFRAARSLDAFCGRPEVIEALLQTLEDPDVAVQNGAAVSLAIGVAPAGSAEHKMAAQGMPGDWQGIARTLVPPVGEPPHFQLDVTQTRVLDALVRQFQKFGEASTRSDEDWGFRPVGNAILAFGAEGASRLQALLEQKHDRQLADLAWQVLYVRQAVSRYTPLGNAEKEAEAVYKKRPNP